MAQEIYRRKKPGEQDSAQPEVVLPQQHPLGKIPPPPELPKPLASGGQTAEAIAPAPGAPVPAAPSPTPTPLLNEAPPLNKTPPVERVSDQAWHQQLQQLIQVVTVSDGKFEHRFRCEAPMERMRAESLMEKEAGTVAWIDAEVQPGDVFYDIGASTGIYSLPAAQRVGNNGTVYAFEPHVANAKALLGNVAVNNLGPRLKVISTPLSDVVGFEEFHYLRPDAGSSMSQLGERRDAVDQAFEPCFSEWKMGTTIDTLIDLGAIRAADVIKIDVDGNELKVLRGMQELLTGTAPPRSVQVEIHQRGRAEILELMQSYGYELVDRHYTALGKQRLAAGHDAESIAYLAVFRR